jgi:hypothetical protein
MLSALDHVDPRSWSLSVSTALAGCLPIANTMSRHMCRYGRSGEVAAAHCRVEADVCCKRTVLVSPRPHLAARVSFSHARDRDDVYQQAGCNAQASRLDQALEPGALQSAWDCARSRPVCSHPVRIVDGQYDEAPSMSPVMLSRWQRLDQSWLFAQPIALQRSSCWSPMDVNTTTVRSLLGSWNAAVL